MVRFRQTYNQTFAAAGSADVVIVTLGLVECWFDRETGVYLNGAPSIQLSKAHPGRFEFHLLDYNDILDALREVYQLLSAARGTPPKFLVTVSPVGLVSTFRDHDVLVANCYSKSVQRAAVDAFVAEHDAHYFPSYEYVTLTDRRFAWTNKDFRHVRPETVDRIMADVLAAYVGPSAGQSLLDARGRATAHLDDGDAETAVEIIEAHLTAHGEQESLLWLYAQALRKLKRFEEAIKVCKRLIEIDSIYKRSAGRTGVFPRPVRSRTKPPKTRSLPGIARPTPTRTRSERSAQRIKLVEPLGQPIMAGIAFQPGLQRRARLVFAAERGEALRQQEHQLGRAPVQAFEQFEIGHRLVIPLLERMEPRALIAELLLRRAVEDRGVNLGHRRVFLSPLLQRAGEKAAHCWHGETGLDRCAELRCCLLEFL